MQRNTILAGVLGGKQCHAHIEAMMEPQHLRDIIAVEYLPKFAASLSIICSTVLITEVIQDFKRRSASGASGIISRILLSISAADLIFSL